MVILFVPNRADGACQDIASFGSPDWSSARMSSSLGRPDGQFGPEFSERGAVKGSPVVPGSTQKILEEGEMVLYTVTILKGHYQVCLCARACLLA